jgi:hypothetical protein
MSNQIELVKQQAYLQVANENSLTIQSVSFLDAGDSAPIEVSACKGTAGTLGSLGTATGCFGTFGSAGTYGCGA